MTNVGEMTALIARVWLSSQAALRERLDAIDAAGAALLAGSLDDERRAAARVGAHKLRGSLGTFGLPEGSELAAELEDMLRAPGAPPVLRLSELAEQLRAIVNTGPVFATAEADAASAPPIDTPTNAAARGGESAEASAEASVDVVMVDDDIVLAQLVRHALETRGYTAKVISDGRAAIDALTGPAPLRCRLLLLDVDLPGLDGLAVLRQLTAAGVTGTTPTIMLTVRASEREILEALQAGAVDHVTKPFSMSVLMERIRLGLER